MTETEYYALKAVQPLLDKLNDRITYLETTVVKVKEELEKLQSEAIKVIVKEGPTLNLDNHTPEEWMDSIRYYLTTEVK